jgi:hypothetical protein
MKTFRMLVQGLALAAALACTPARATENAILDLVRKAGIQQCTQTWKLMAEHVLENAERHAARVTWAQGDASRHMASAVVEAVMSYGTMLAVLSVVPMPDGRCDGSVTRTIHMGASCDAVMRLMPNVEYIGKMERDVALWRRTQGSPINFYVQPAGSGCQVSMHEVVYGGP